ncbi:MAG: hypothetical protein GXX96_06745 [Planctomycetaceae bacterium]|nr:hypothetical protein [Planctomycetaceae bacterium]
MSKLTRVLVPALLLLNALPAWSQTSASSFQPELLDAQFTARNVRPGDPLAVTLMFRNNGRRTAPTDYRVFLHFEQPQGCQNLRVNADHEPTEPTSSWVPGQVTVDGPRTVFLPGDLAEGEYHVHVGLYDYAGTGGRVLDTYAAGTIQVSRQAPAAADAAPPRLAAAAVAQRREKLAARIDPRDRVTLDHNTWRFDLQRRGGAWSLLDKSSGVLWTSSPALPRFGRVVLSDGNQTVAWRIDRFDQIEVREGRLLLTVQPTVGGQPTGATVTFTIAPDVATAGLRLAYATKTTGSWKVSQVRLLEEAVPVTAEEDGCFYVPYRLGIERAAADAFPGSQRWSTYNSLSMAMCGAIKQGSALLIDWDQVDTHLTLHATWHDVPLLPGRQAESISLNIDGPAGVCTMLPLGAGGYVEIAKAYRRCAEAKGWRTTWARKRAQFPTVDRIFGAADFKPFVFSRVLPSSRFNDTGRERTYLGFTFDEAAQCAEHWRKDLDIDRAYVVLAGWIEGGYDVRHPDVLPAAPECGGNEGLIDAARRIRDCGYLFGLHDNYQDMYEDAASWDHAWLNKNAQGESKKGGNWNGGQAWQVCAIKQVELAARPDTNLPKIAELFGPTIYFIDTVFAWPLVTCEDPQHPMTRRDDLVWKSKLCMLAKQHFGLFGSEEGREWAVPCADYLEGIFGHQTDSEPGAVIPLFPLVYSDCVQIMTHQGNRIGSGDEKKVADHILFAEMFLPQFGSHLYWQADQEPAAKIVPLEPRIESLGDRKFAITYRWKALEPIADDFSCFVHFTSAKYGKMEDIAFQNDHAPTLPTSKWPVGKVVEDGPHTVTVPEGFDGTAEIALGLTRKGQRLILAARGVRSRYPVGAVAVSGDRIEFEPLPRSEIEMLWNRADGGWGQDLCETDRVIKNVWEVLSPLNRITAETPLDDHRFLTPDRLLQRTRFGDVTITVAYDRPAEFDGCAVPAYGFVVESPSFIAFCAKRYGNLQYDTPTLFTARSLDGRPLAESAKVRVYHGFGDSRIRLGGKEFVVEREEVVSVR